MKLWQGIVLGIVFFLVGYPLAAALGIPLDVRSLAFCGLLTLLVAAFLLAPLPAGQRRALFRVRGPLLPWMLAILGGKLLFCQLSVVLAELFHYGGQNSPVREGTLPVQVLAMAVLAPLCEELIYRGGLTQGLCRRLPWEAGVVIPAVLFAVSHVWPMWPQVLVTGLLLGYLCWYTGSLGYGILIHMLYNGSAFLNNTGCYRLIQWNRPVGIALSLGIVAAGLGLTFWALRGFTRCADRLQAAAEPKP